MLLSRYILLSVLMVTMGACSGNQALESRFAPANPNNPNNTITNNNPSPPNKGENEVKLPDDFPQDIPIYSQAKLITVDGKQTVWSSIDPLNLIIEFYQQELTAQNWTVSQPEENVIIATKPDTQESLRLSFTPNNDETQFTLTYEKETTALIIPNNNNNTNNNNSSIDTNNNKNTVVDNSYLEPLKRLQIISPSENLKPHDTISRREYARWLVKANNLIYSDVNGKLIRLATPNSQPVFTDIGTNDPDFAMIQGLAQAGLIPSSLTQDTSSIVFKPDEALTREDLIRWKIPLDFRQKLPNASLDTIKETWGFQDATKINTQAWAPLYVDWQNGEASNIRRGFGYITLFQPQKPVTYEEAGRILSSFGYQGDIRNLADVTGNNQSTSP
ncbi:S-layer protein [Geminocystis sp. CENA526]|uniref:S-layer homology domain-containing protein n=1 Tax=Geminocystis sp. CENA526 TaxID=1355871 RepID=UPI003D6EB6A0